MGDTPVATLRPSGSTVAIYYVHTDHLGTARKVTRPSDNGLMWRFDPDTYGSVVPNQNPAGLGTFVYNLGFPGQYLLTETGLYYNYFRTYDPQMGRYLESDPIGLGDGINTYDYTRENPVSLADQLGLYPAIAVTLPDGPVYIPLTTVKNPAQAAAYGLPVGTPTAIAVPTGANPQGDVACWAQGSQKSLTAFKKYWKDPSTQLQGSQWPNV